MASKFLLYLSAWLTAILPCVLSGETGIPRSARLYFIQEPQDVIGIRGKSLTMNCSANRDARNGPVTILWYKGGDLVNDPRREVLSNGSLFFRRVVHRKTPLRSQGVRSDEGSYHCSANNRNGLIVSAKAKLEVARLLHFSGIPQNAQVTEGEAVRFQCRIQGIPQPVITWEKNRQPLPHTSHRFTVLASGVLQIHGVLQTDAGHYRCIAKNVVKQRHSPEANLTVIAARDGLTKTARFIVGPPNQEVSVNESVVLECLATGLALPQVSWSKKDGKSVQLDDRIKLIGPGNLMISKVRKQDAGEYVCRADNQEGKIATTKCNLTVNEPPRLLKGASEFQVRVGETVRLNCTFVGSPTPIVTWIKDSVPVSASGRVKLKYGGKQLVFSGVVSNDSGLFQCFARNKAGTAHHTIWVHVQPAVGAPMPPTHVKVKPISSEKVRLSWSPATSKSTSIVAYSVHYNSAVGGSELQKVITDTSAIIDGLTPYTNYTFYLMAYNSDGPSPHSALIYARTLEDVPTSPAVIRVNSAGTTTLKVKWDKMESVKARGVITRYKVMYRKHNHPSEHVQEFQTNKREYLITGLESNTRYDIRLLAGTKIGFPKLEDDKWPWVTQKTDLHSESDTPEPPFLQTKALNASSVRVMWQSGHIVQVTGFKLTFHPLDSKQDQGSLIFSNISQDRYIITNLKPDKEYEVRLLAYNQHGNGQEAVNNVKTLQIGETADDLMDPEPPAPRQVEPVPNNDSAIYVAWQSPVAANLVLTYTVRYTRVPDSENEPHETNRSDFRYVFSTNKHVVVTGLEPYTMYAFAVKAQKGNVEGPYGIQVRCRTLEGRPSAPLNPDGWLRTPSAVELQWRPPEHSNGVIVSYYIMYSEDSEQPEDGWSTREENGTRTKAVVEELQMNTIYYFKVKAATNAGKGPPTSVIQIKTTGATMKPPGDAPVWGGDRGMGIFIGGCIGVGCIIICTVVFLLKNRCCLVHRNVSGHPPVQTNCNGHGPGPPDGHVLNRSPNNGTPLDEHELESLMSPFTQTPDGKSLNSKRGGANHAEYKKEERQRPPNGVLVRMMPNGNVKTGLANTIDHNHVQETQLLDGIKDETCTKDAQPARMYSSLEDIDRSLVGDSADEEFPETDNDCSGSQQRVDTATGEANPNQPSAENISDRHDFAPGSPHNNLSGQVADDICYENCTRDTESERATSTHDPWEPCQHSSPHSDSRFDAEQDTSRQHVRASSAGHVATSQSASAGSSSPRSLPREISQRLEEPPPPYEEAAKENGYCGMQPSSSSC